MNCFDFLATVLVSGGRGNGKKRSISDESGILEGLLVLAGVITGATGIGDTEGLWAATVGFFELSGEELNFSELLDVCTIHAVSKNFNSSSGGAEGR